MLKQMVQRRLTVNTGSSSLKVAVYELGLVETRILSGTVERVGAPGGHLRLTDAHGATLLAHGDNFPDHGTALDAML